VIRKLLAAAVLLAVVAPPAAAQVRATYVYSLSNFSGRLPYDWARMYVDADRDETYVIYQNVVRVFNAAAMETFRFGDDLDLGHLIDVVVDEVGDIILLSYNDSHPVVTRCNFRGVPLRPIEVSDLPPGIGFSPSRMLYRAGRLYFVSLNGATVVITDPNGAFREYIDLAALLKLNERQKSEAELVGFTVDERGNIYFTIPVFFKAYRVTPSKDVTEFGRPGSAPGRFGISAGIAVDSRGNVFVADKLKCVVIVFDKNFNFITEFGRRGTRPENLILPDDLAIDGHDHLYVTQARRRGVSVFALTHD
jgi:hypothetical protein